MHSDDGQQYSDGYPEHGVVRRRGCDLAHCSLATGDTRHHCHHPATLANPLDMSAAQWCTTSSKVAALHYGKTSREKSYTGLSSTATDQL